MMLWLFTNYKNLYLVISMDYTVGYITGIYKLQMGYKFLVISLVI